MPTLETYVAELRAELHRDGRDAELRQRLAEMTVAIGDLKRPSTFMLKLRCGPLFWRVGSMFQSSPK